MSAIVILACMLTPPFSYATAATTGLVTKPGLELDTTVRKETVTPAGNGPTVMEFAVIGVE